MDSKKSPSSEGTDPTDFVDVFETNHKNNLSTELQKDLYDDDTVDPIYRAKAHILNEAIQEIGMGKYQVCFEATTKEIILTCNISVVVVRSRWFWLVCVSSSCNGCVSAYSYTDILPQRQCLAGEHILQLNHVVLTSRDDSLLLSGCQRTNPNACC